jgi:tetratricopeptide (TPR) repeat protein
MEPRKRKRGIKASREKLEAAMLARGFETQAALAQQILIDEGLSKAPKDLVNKVFREQGVSTHNLARVAKALNVAAHTIYLAKGDSQFNDTISNQSQNLLTKTATVNTEHILNKASLIRSTTHTSIYQKAKFWQTNVILILFALFSLVLTALFIHQHNAVPESTRIHSAIGKTLIVVQPHQLMAELVQNFVEHFKENDEISAILPTQMLNESISAQEALIEWQAHAVISFSVTPGENYQIIQAQIRSKSHTSILLQKVIRPSEMKAASVRLTNELAQNTIKFINGQPIDELLSQSEQALNYYLLGRDLLFISHSAQSYENAKTHLLKAITLDNNFVDAFAELCRVYVRISWMKDETATLENAAKFCQKGELINSNSRSLKSAQAELYARTGEIPKAFELIKSIKLNNVYNADLLAVAAEVFFVFNRRYSSEEDLTQYIEAYASQAISLANNHWRAYNTLGNFYFSVGDIHNAKKYYLAATNVVKHEVILANLGTMQLCFDELDQAQNTYHDLIENVKDNYLGYENLGTVYLFQHQYQQALEQKLHAIKQQPDISIHQTWASLAEVYLRLDQPNKAAFYYTKALRQLERDELLKNTVFSDELFKLYYQVKLHRLSKNSVLLIDINSKVTQFIQKEASYSLQARAHLAWLAEFVGNTNAKENIWQQVIKICPVYKRSPELVFI